MPISGEWGMKRCGTICLYTGFGILFGGVFPCASLFLDYEFLRTKPTSIGTLFVTNPVHLIVALAPLVLGVVFHMIGRKQSRLEMELERRSEVEAGLHKTTQDLEVALAKAAVSSDAKSQFLAMMSHELRTPLNAILGFSEVLGAQLFGPLGDERYAGYAADIHRSGSHLLDLINDILDFSKLGAGKMDLSETDIDVRDVATEAIHFLDHQARQADVTVKIAAGFDIPSLRGDERRIKQVLLNILSNAIKFTPPGGEVMLSGRATPTHVVIEIADTGIGMTQSEVSVAMEPFGQIDSSLSRKYEGTGLGLPLCKGMLELHGGTLTLRSEPDIGTTVIMAFPAERAVRLVA
jgi:signal transduction histidine kinase